MDLTKERWRVVERLTRTAIKSGWRTIAYVQIDGFDNERANLLAAAPELLELAERYLTECGECAGVGIMPDDEPCTECVFIRRVINKARTGDYEQHLPTVPDSIARRRKARGDTDGPRVRGIRSRLR